jgi:excisionase family DNA binding protein
MAIRPSWPLDVPFAASYLNVSVSTVRRLVKGGELSARRVGSRLRFETAELLAYCAPVETRAQAHTGFDFRAAGCRRSSGTSPSYERGTADDAWGCRTRPPPP